MDVGMLRRVVYNGNGNGGSSSTVVCEQQKARAEQKGWAAVLGRKDYCRCPAMMTRWCAKGSQVLTGGRV